MRTTYKRWADVPPNLKTKTSLGREGLRPPKGLRPTAYMKNYRGVHDYALYNVSDAVPKRKATSQQLENLAKARRTASTCKQCNHVFGDSQSWRAKPHRYVVLDICHSCNNENELEKARLASNDAKLWAQDALSSKTIILDTETTDLSGYVIELAAINPQGETLLDTKIALPDDPQNGYRRWINPGAMMVHGINYDNLRWSPQWPDVRGELVKIASKAERIVTYNAEFDRSRLLATDRAWGVDAEEDWWDDGVFALDKWGCAMENYRVFLGVERWVKLGGDHSALGDCLACLERIKEMAHG